MLGKDIQRRGSGSEKRRFRVPDHSLENIIDILVTALKGLLHRLVVIGHDLLVFALVVALFLESNRIRPQLTRPESRSERHNRG